MNDILARVGWSKRYFAGVMDVEERTVHSWCAGEVTGPSYRAGMRYLELVARILGV